MLCSTLALLLCAASAGLVHLVRGHGSMIMPPARNSIDSLLPPWSNGKHAPTGVIDPKSAPCTNGTSICNNGQSPFWFSQGCSIGCKVPLNLIKPSPRPTILPRACAASELFDRMGGALAGVRGRIRRFHSQQSVAPLH